jgi:hypothetical protein
MTIPPWINQNVFRMRQRPTLCICLPNQIKPNPPPLEVPTQFNTSNEKARNIPSPFPFHSLRFSKFLLFRYSFLFSLPIPLPFNFFLFFFSFFPLILRLFLRHPLFFRCQSRINRKERERGVKTLGGNKQKNHLRVFFPFFFFFFFFLFFAPPRLLCKSLLLSAIANLLLWAMSQMKIFNFYGSYGFVFVLH